MTAYNTIPDTEIMLKVAESDSQALEELYDRYSPLLYTLIKKIVDDKNIAEEVLTDVFVIIWRKISKFNFENDSVYTWLVTLTRNKAVDRLRRDQSDEELPEYNDEYEDDFILPQLSEEIEPIDINNANSAKEKFEEALNKLTDAQKYVIYLAYYDGKTQQEIAKKLNIPLPTVKSKIQVAMSNLKQNLLKGVEE